LRLEILQGPGGTGKTTMMLDAARRRASGDGAATWLVVPDQSTFLMEKKVLDSLGDKDGNLLRVFSINRLARHILMETGGTARPFLDASGKGILVYRIVREMQDRLPLFADAIRKGGFAKVAGDLISEFKRYGVSYEDIRLAAEKTTDMRLSVKLHELALVGEAYAGSMDGHGYLDGEDRLAMAADRLDNMPGMEGVFLCFDQFLRFSPVQLRLILALMLHAESVTVTLRLPSTDASGTAFRAESGRPARDALDFLLKQAAEKGVPVRQTCTTGIDYRHAAGSGLAFLNRSLSASGNIRCKDRIRDIRMMAHANPEEEMHACARRIVGLCRDDGLRFREIAVLVPDTAEYASGVRRIFHLHGIPHFMDRKESLAGNPVSVTLLAVFDILRGGWRHDDVFRLLKSGLLPIGRSLTDRLENHALAVGMRGRRMWCDGVLSDPEMEEAREILAIPLAGFRRSVHGPVPVRVALEAYIGLLLSWEVPGAIETRALCLERDGHLVQAGHMRQIWQSACDLMDQVLELSGEGTVTLTELHGMLQTGLESGSTGIIPPALDEVFVGTPSRSRTAEIRHLFVLGAIEGWIPSGSGGQGLLSDNDRRTLSGMGVELAPDTRSVSQERRDELESVLTMASQGLWLSRPVSDTEGKGLQPSPVWRELHNLFPLLQEGWTLESEPGSDGYSPEVDWATTPAALLDALVPLLRDTGISGSPNLVQAMFQICGRQTGMEHARRMVVEGLNWRNLASLSPEWFTARYGGVLTGSISSLEMYRKCPFSWFARHAAMLQEREESGLRDVGFGLLMHDILDAVLVAVERDGGWEAYQESRLPDYVADAVRAGIRKGTGISPLHPGLAAWFAERLEKAAMTAAGCIAGQIRAGSFRPYGHELGFGGTGSFPPYAVRLPDGGLMRLQGRLDRLDMHEAPDGRHVRVIDYKSGDRALALSDIANGLSLQLPAYLAVALSSLREDSAHTDGKPVFPAGIFHMRMEPPDIRTRDSSVEGAESERNRRMRLTGFVVDDPAILSAMDGQILLSGTSEILKAGMNRDGSISARTRTLTRDEFEQLGKLVDEVMADLGGDLSAGRIPVRPVRTAKLKACDSCPYGHVCRFEPGIGGVFWDRPAIIGDTEIRRSGGAE